MSLEISKNLFEEIKILIKNQSDTAIQDLLTDEHHADIAEILDELNLDQATYIIKLLDSEKTSEILMELDED